MVGHRTYQILSPIATHYRPASCADVDCAAHAHGWRTTVDETTPLGQEQAAYIRRGAGRRHAETRDNNLTTFTFEAGQVCFAAADHRLPLDRPEHFRVLTGPAPGVIETARAHRPDDWVDSFAEHVDAILAVRNAG